LEIKQIIVIAGYGGIPRDKWKEKTDNVSGATLWV
jgi:hypothetical protein